MDVKTYEVYKKQILEELPTHIAYKKYKRLLEIFVMDCAIDLHEEYWGNNVKRKAKILFELQEKFLNFKDE